MSTSPADAASIEHLLELVPGYPETLTVDQAVEQLNSGAVWGPNGPVTIGTSDQDTLRGYSLETAYGLSGDDVFTHVEPGAILSGGGGTDTFGLAHADIRLGGATTTILDFEVGVDRLAFLDEVAPPVQDLQDVEFEVSEYTNGQGLVGTEVFFNLSGRPIVDSNQDAHEVATVRLEGVTPEAFLESIDPNTANSAPEAIDDTAETDEDDSVTIDVLANDRDPNEDPLTVVSASAQNGVVVANADNTLGYTPNADFFGTDTIDYVISDGSEQTDAAQVFVDVAPVNDAPVASNDAAEADEDGSVIIDVLGNDSDVDGDALTISSATAQNGAVSINDDQTLTYSPDPDFYGMDSVSYTIADTYGATAEGVVDIDVSPVNDAPVASDDEAALENGEVLVDVLANDTDADGNMLTISSFTAEGGSAEVVEGGIHFKEDDDPSTDPMLFYTVSDGTEEDQGEVSFFGSTPENAANDPNEEEDDDDDDDDGGLFGTLESAGWLLLILAGLGAGLGG